MIAHLPRAIKLALKIRQIRTRKNKYRCIQKRNLKKKTTMYITKAV